MRLGFLHNVNYACLTGKLNELWELLKRRLKEGGSMVGECAHACILEEISERIISEKFVCTPKFVSYEMLNVILT